MSPPDDVGGTGGAMGAGAAGGGAAGGGAGAGGTTAAAGCVGNCCPTDATCYSDAAKGASSPGAECLATRDNTGQDHIQMRQAWIRATRPLGTTDAVVYGVLAGRTELPEPVCNQGNGALGSGGYIQLVDFFLGGADHSKHYAYVGYSTFVTKATLGATLQDGFCYGKEDYTPPSGGTPPVEYALTTDEVASPNSAQFPPGLPKPQGGKTTPWKVGPVKAKRLDADFDLAKDRLALLAKFDANGELGKDGYTGVFYYDDATGYAHGYGAMAWTVVYSADGKSHMSIPIREPEMRSTFNDPTHPNCVGQYLHDGLDPATKCATSDPKAPAWGGGNCTGTTGSATCQPGEGPGSTKAYFLISELQQIYSSDLGTTLCVNFAGNDSKTSKPFVDAQGFYDVATKGCKTAKWDPTLADDAGIPKGDWCAKDNGPATDTCHDAWKTESFHVFVGGKIKVAADPAQPMPTCAF